MRARICGVTHIDTMRAHWIVERMAGVERSGGNRSQVSFGITKGAVHTHTHTHTHTRIKAGNCFTTSSPCVGGVAIAIASVVRYFVYRALSRESAAAEAWYTADTVHGARRSIVNIQVDKRPPHVRHGRHRISRVRYVASPNSSMEMVDA